MNKIPLRKNRKEPRDNDWRRNEYSSQVIDDWKAEGGNVGHSLGAEDLVIDVDPKHEDAEGRSARELLDALELEFDLDFSEDLIVETGARLSPPGYHVYVTKPADVKIREKLKDVFGGAIEFKAIGRQVLAPGCIHPDGGTYRIIQGTQIRPCPTVLLEALTRPPAKTATGDAEVDPSQLGEALAQLDPAEFSDYDDWRDMLFACHHGTGGSPAGLETFKAWSARDPNYTDHGTEVEYFWEAADTERGEGRTIHSLYYQLQKRGLGMPGSDPKADFADLLEELMKTEGPPARRPNWHRAPKTKSGRPGLILGNRISNVREFMRINELRFGACQFTRRTFNLVTGKPKSDLDALDLKLSISKEMGVLWSVDPTIALAHEAIDSVAKENPFHPVQDYFKALEWDKEPRLKTWLIDHAGADDNEYTREASRLILVAVVARVFFPGSKFDTVPIFEGFQGSGKSSLVRLLGLEWPQENLPPFNSTSMKDVIAATLGKLVVELPEISGLIHSKVDTVKGYLSTTVDNCRKPYGREAEDYPRQFIMIGTTNDREYLNDSTGGRRFIPLPLGTIKFEDVPIDQLYAEAFQELKADPTIKERLHLPEKTWIFAEAMQSARRSCDSWEDPLSQFIEKKSDEGHDRFFTNDELLREATDYGSASKNQTTTRRLTKVMAVLGFHKSRQRVNGVRAMGYTDAKD